MATYAANMDSDSSIERSASQSAFTALTVALLMCVPVVLSMLFFSGQSLRLDEAQSLWQSGRSVGYIFKLIAQDVHVPLYHLLLHFWRIAFGDTVTSARLMSLAFYVASIPALYMLGKLAYNRRVGLFATFLFSISPFMNWYGNEIRMYTLFTFLVIVNQYFFVRIFKNKEHSDDIWALYVLTALLGVFSHYFFFLNLASQVVFYLVERKTFPEGSFKRFMAAMVIVAAAFLPWAWYVLHLGQAGNQEPLLAVPTTVNLFSTMSQFVFGFQNDNINTVLLSLWPVTILFAFLGLRKRSGKNTLPQTQYFMITLLVSIAIAFVVSFVVAPVFVSRYLIFTVTSLYLLLAGLFENYTLKAAHLARYGLAAVMVLTLAIEITSPTTPVKENYEGATAYLNTHVTAQDVVVLSAPFTVYPVQYYYRGDAPLTTLPVWDQYTYGPIPAFSTANLKDEVAKAVGSSQNVYLLLSYNQGYEKDIKDYFDSHYQRLYTESYSDDLTLYEYKLRYDTNATQVSIASK
jgi:mannosyltransferase